MTETGTNLTRRTAHFEAAASMLATLGDEMIGDAVLGLVELIKNAWDADATDVGIELHAIDHPEKAVLVLRDDGIGMNADDVEQRWLVPATRGKRTEKDAGWRSARGRIPLGEKGIGRFATQKLARTLEMVTRKEGFPEVVVSIDWDAFQNGLLADIPIEVVEREPVTFVDGATGTQLRMARVREAWGPKELAKLQRDIRRLQRPPLSGAEEPDFRVSIDCPEHPEFEDVEPPDLLERSHFLFTAIVDASGECEWEYACQHPDADERVASGRDQLGAAISPREDGRLSSGPFIFSIAAWDRSQAAMRQVGLTGKDLDFYCGVSLYRDGLRVYPYGERGNDWLFLDRDRPNDPSRLLGNNQVVGLVQVDQADNRELRDKANRDGLIENAAFFDLRELVRAALQVFMKQWRADKPGGGGHKRGRGVSDGLPAAREVAQALKRSAKADTTVTVPRDALPGGAAVPGESVAIPQPSAVDALMTQLAIAEADADLSERERTELLELTAIGMAAQRSSHEFLRRVASARNDLAELKRSLRRGDQVERARSLETTLTILADEVRVLAPDPSALGGRERRRTSLASEVIKAAHTALRPRFEAEGVDLTIESAGADVAFYGRFSPAVQVLENLLDNARHWSGGPGGNRRVLVRTHEARRSIIVGDTGGGIVGGLGSEVFEPFTSMKPDGSGLGLYISRKLAEASGASLRLAEPSALTEWPRWATGAAFEFTLPPEKETEDE